MKERDLSAENQAVTLGDEFMNTMLANIQQNTEGIKANNEQLERLSGTMEGLIKLNDRVEGLARELGTAREVLTGVKTEVERAALSPEQVNRLRIALKTHTDFFEQPLKKEIHHRHFLGRPLIALFLMGCLVIACVVIAVDAHERADQYSASDIKFRSLKLIKDSLLLREIFSEEKQFVDNPDQFRKDVVAEEERREALVERMLQLNEKKAEIEQLERAEKRINR